MNPSFIPEWLHAPTFPNRARTADVEGDAAGITLNASIYRMAPHRLSAPAVSDDGVLLGGGRLGHGPVGRRGDDPVLA